EHRARAAALLVEQRQQQVRGFDEVVVAADGERLRVAERLLEPGGELVHSHGGKDVAAGADFNRATGRSRSGWPCARWRRRGDRKTSAPARKSCTRCRRICA